MSTIQSISRIFFVLVIALSLNSALGVTAAQARGAGAHAADVTPPTVDSFGATSPSASLDIAITVFSASDDVAVTGYLISESAVAPDAGDAGWSGAVPSSYTVGADGSYSLYPWAKDADGNVSAVFASPASVLVDTAAPTVISSVRANPSPTSAASVDFTVTFSEPVTAVDSADFSLTTTGVSGASITGPSGTGAMRTVTVNTGSGSGSIRLNVPNTATITDLAGNALAGLPFTTGEAYPVYRVWYVATTGSDSNSCAATGSPCLTINAALGKAAAGDMIEVAIGTYTGTSGAVATIEKSITLSGGWDASFTAQSGLSTIDGGAVRQGIYTTGNPVIVDRFQIRNGFHDFWGGGIYIEGALTLNNSIVSGNVNNWNGGGIYNTGTLVINNTTISGNSAGFSGIVSSGGGGGIFNGGTVTLNNSTVSNNTVIGGLQGNGIFLSGGAITLNNSTVSGNKGSAFESIYIHIGSLTLNNSTISNNQRPGVRNRGGSVTLKNTMIARNGINGDCYTDSSHGGTVTSLGYNLIGNGSGCLFTPTTGDQVGSNASPINPLLGPLQDNGGPTFTHALLSGSPAFNAGNPALPGSGGGACLATDQRGIARPAEGACDIGAYEVDVPFTIPTPLAPIATTPDTTPTYTWTKIQGATQYEYQLFKSTGMVYTKTVGPGVCGANTCSNTPTTILGVRDFKWRVRAKVGGVWKSYSSFTVFKVTAIGVGLWRGPGLEFYVTPTTRVDNFAISIYVNGCGSYKITHTPLVPIVKKRFAFAGPIYASGTFISPTTAMGKLGLSSFFISGCGYISGGPFSWTAKWRNASQPGLAGGMSLEVEDLSVTIAPEQETPFTFTP